MVLSVVSGQVLSVPVEHRDLLGKSHFNPNSLIEGNCSFSLSRAWRSLKTAGPEPVTLTVACLGPKGLTVEASWDISQKSAVGTLHERRYDPSNSRSAERHLDFLKKGQSMPAFSHLRSDSSAKARQAATLAASTSKPRLTPQSASTKMKRRPQSAHLVKSCSEAAAGSLVHALSTSASAPHSILAAVHAARDASSAAELRAAQPVQRKSRDGPKAVHLSKSQRRHLHDWNFDFKRYSNKGKPVKPAEDVASIPPADEVIAQAQAQRWIANARKLSMSVASLDTIKTETK